MSLMTTDPPKKRGRPRLYEWDKWLVAGRSMTLEYGRDYRCSQMGMVQQLRNNAKSRGLKVVIDDDRYRIHISVMKETE